MSVPPFFIVGFQRSGTTLLRLMLDSHSAIAVPLDAPGLWARYEGRLGEFGHLATDADARRLVEALLAEERIRLWQTSLTAEQVLAARRRPGMAGIIEGFYGAYAAARGKAAWGDKDPGNMTRMDRIVDWFPEARFIHIIRDGRDACLSHREQSFGIQDPLECALAWQEEVTWVRRIGRILGPQRYHELRYEDLLEDPPARLMALCAFLGVAFEPGMLEYHRRVSETVPDEKRHIWPKLDRPPEKSNAGRWRTRMSASQRAAFEKRAGTALAECGYETLRGPLRGAWVEELKSGGRRLASAIRRRLG